MDEHSTKIDKRSNDSAMVQHMASYPGHSFDLASAKIIWRTRSKYESQFVEAACISRFPSCNISKGEIKVTPAMSAFTTYIAGFHRRSANNISTVASGSITAPGSITSPQPVASTHLRPLRAPPPSRSPGFGNTVSPTSSNSGTSHMDNGNSSRQHISTPKTPPPAVCSMSQPAVSSRSQLSISAPISQPTNLSHSSQILTSSIHRSLRRIINQDQEISTSPRRLRSSNTLSSSQM